MACLLQTPSNVWTSICEFLFGIFEAHTLTQDYSLFAGMTPIVCNLAPVHDCIDKSLSDCSFMDVYQLIRNVYRVVGSRLHLGQLGSQRWETVTRRCAVRACAHQTGLFTPVDMGRGILYGLSDKENYRGSILSTHEKETFVNQHTIEELINGGRPFLVVCSTNCYLCVCSLLECCEHWDNVTVVRGTHLANPRMLHRFYRAKMVYEAQHGTKFYASWQQFNAMIDKLDVPMETQEKEFFALYLQWRYATARGRENAVRLGELVNDWFNRLKQEDKEQEDIALCEPCPFLIGRMLS